MQIKDFTGNEKLVSLLKAGRLPQSSLLTGLDGVGKKTLALLLAQLANCKQPHNEDVCGVCRSCLKAQSGNHPDIRLVRAEGATIKIQAVREINQEAHYRPHEGLFRFFIIDEAERMTEEAANSLLKTLEEPPETTRIILVSAYPQRLLATIRSRCQIFSFLPLSADEIQTYLEETTDLDRPQIRAGFSGGSLGTALQLDLEPLLEFRDLLLEMLEQWIGRRSFQQLYERIEASPLRARMKSRDAVRELLDLLEMILFDIYYLQVRTPGRVINGDRLDVLEPVATRLSLSGIQAFLAQITRSQRDLDQYVNPLMCFETLWLSVPDPEGAKMASAKR